MYGLGGERRLTELELPALEGYRRSRPVRIGNGASNQLQLDAYGELVQLSWHWHVRGQSPDDDYWRFLLELVEAAYERWREPDHGLWEVRGQPRHFVYSKVMCWLAIDRGIQLATECLRKAPLTRWRRAAAEIKATIDKRGFDRRRGVFVQFFGGRHLDAIREELMVDGLLRRYQACTTHDGLPGQEGVFLPASFWLAEALARQERLEDAREVFDRAASTCNDLGLFAEEYNPGAGMMLGNFPQGLTHLSHMAAAVALSQIQPSATHAT